jgi:hypothetical protein
MLARLGTKRSGCWRDKRGFADLREAAPSYPPLIMVSADEIEDEPRDMMFCAGEWLLDKYAWTVDREKTTR